MHALWSRWAPPLERSKLVTMAYSGSYFGTVISMGVCGLLGEHLGWESIFYVAGFYARSIYCFIRLNLFYLSLYIGTFAILWWLLWFVLVKECPQEDRFIKRTELDYISACLGTTSNLHVLSLYKVFSFVTCFHLIKFIYRLE